MEEKKVKSTASKAVSSKAVSSKRPSKHKGLYGPTDAKFDPKHEGNPEALETYREEKAKEIEALDAISKAIATLQALGFEVTIPTSEEDREKHKESLVKLGIKEPKAKVTKSKPPTHITFTLVTRHIVGGVVYGPGEVTLPYKDELLYRSLIEQDARCISAFRDTIDYVREPRCFMIATGRGQDRHNKYSKVEVSSDFFNSPQFYNATSLEVSKVDVAGYNTNTSFSNNF